MIALFLVDGQPNEIRRVLTPKWNTLIFFEVTPISFHQVNVVANLCIVINEPNCTLGLILSFLHDLRNREDFPSTAEHIVSNLQF